jgi:hypothetical protein
MADDKYDRVESVSTSIKNFLYIGGVIIAILLLLGLQPTIKKEAEIKTLEILGLKIDLSRKLNASLGTEGNTDTAQTEPLIRDVAKAIDYGGEFWVYIGATARGSRTDWSTKLFSATQVPSPGKAIKAIVDVYKREDRPRLVQGEWKLGAIQGLVRSGDRIKVLSIDSIPGGENRSLWWARAQSP